MPEVVHPEPLAVLRLSTRLVPATAAKLGTVADHALHVELLLVEYLYSSAIVPVPPEPAVVVTVKVCPAQTVASVGLFVIPGATGCATTVQLTSLLEVKLAVQPLTVMLFIFTL